MSIVAVVLTKNEEANIKKCLAALTFCDEILVIDDYSVDKTVSIAKKLGARVVKRQLNNDFSGQRNFAFTKTNADWLLFIDADEIVTPELAKEIVKSIKLKGGDVNGYSLKRRDHFFGASLVYAKKGNQTIVRLVKKGFGSWKRAVHETLVVKGKVGELGGELIHNSHPSMSEFVDSTNHYSDLHRLENKSEGKPVNLAIIILLPTLKFLESWIIGGAYKDAERGIVYALMGAFHSFLSWSKQWLNQRGSH